MANPNCGKVRLVDLGLTAKEHARLKKKKSPLPKPAPLPNLQYQPLTPGYWCDLEQLFGERGACGGCWCMWWRLRRSQFEKEKGKKNKLAMKKIVASGEIPGILAYTKGEPVAWCAVAPRENYPVLERSRVLKRVDEQPVWSVVCFFVARPFRRQGITVELLKAAVEFAARRGAAIVEGYPVAPKKGNMPDAFAWTGLVSAFRKAGFRKVLRRSATRPIMRYFIVGRTASPTCRTGRRPVSI